VMEELGPMCDGHTDDCDWSVGLGAWITSSGDQTDGCDGRVGPNV
jgi:hypothetical protein